MAVDLYRRAFALQPQDREIALGLAQAMEAEGDASAILLLADVVRRFPDWAEGHEQLARMRSEAGDEKDYARSYRQALAARPHDIALRYSYSQTLMRGCRFKEALDELNRARAPLDQDPKLAVLAAMLASESGQLDLATRLLGRIPDDFPGANLARGRHALRMREPDRAAEVLNRAVRECPEDVSAWAHLALAWRLAGHPRQDWLCGQPGLYGWLELEISTGELESIAAVLRGLHRTRAHPIGQSLRNGTQTRGRLFWRTEPEILRLQQAIQRAVERFVGGLPPEDQEHPLLRHRNARLKMEGSWSVRLKESGFHVSHIHPEGVLSSACYVSIPASLGSPETRDGWLELGSPPAELGLDLPPLASFEPQPGRLVLFPSYLYHGTRPFSEGERLTVAFDLTAR